MPRGSVRGGHRGGRKRGTTNRRTILVDRLLAVGLDCPPGRPRDLVALWSGTRPCREIHAPRLRKEPSRAGEDAKLKALFSIVQDASVAAEQRRKAALAASKYLLPEKPAGTKWRGRADEYGFDVNPERANEYRDKLDRLTELKRKGGADPAEAQEMRTLQADLDLILKHSLCPCPSRYGHAAIKDDKKQLEICRLKLQAGIALTDIEKTDEAHRRVRFETYANGPEERLRRRREELEVNDRFLRKRRFFGSGTARLARKEGLNYSCCDGSTRRSRSLAPVAPARRKVRSPGNLGSPGPRQ